MPAAVKKRTRAAQKLAKLSRWGNSLGLRIPQEGVKHLDLKEGESVACDIGHDRIVIRRASRRRKWTEAELLKGITPRITGDEIWARPVGKEIL